jgi:type VI protein secretion system component VasA
MPAKLRDLSGLYQQMADAETDPHLKRLLSGHAFLLAQMAEKIERDDDWLEEKKQA